MKKKVLISGSNPTVVNDFFMNHHEDITCMSSSDYWEDVKEHIRVWEPDVYVCPIEDSKSLLFGVIKNLAGSSLMSGLPVIIITNEEMLPIVEESKTKNVVLVLCKPITVGEVFKKILTYEDDQKNALLMKKKELEKQLEEIRAQEEALTGKEVVVTDEGDARTAMEELHNVKSILVVDDDKNILKLLKTGLEDRYNVSTMISGKMARKYLEQRTCDLILLDYEMPDENGAEVFKKIRENNATKHIPIIFLTGVADKERIEEVLRLKPQGYMLKPIDLDRLSSVIEKNIGIRVE